MARPRKKVDLVKLRALALIGASHELIAAECDISHDTLTRRFLPLIEESRGKGKIKVLGKAFRMACAGNVRLLELFLVNWLGFTLRPAETIVNVTQNANLQPLTVTEQDKERLSQLAAAVMARARAHGNGQEPPERLGLAS